MPSFDLASLFETFASALLGGGAVLLLGRSLVARIIRDRDEEIAGIKRASAELKASVRELEQRMAHNHDAFEKETLQSFIGLREQVAASLPRAEFQAQYARLEERIEGLRNHLDSRFDQIRNLLQDKH